MDAFRNATTRSAEAKHHTDSAFSSEAYFNTTRLMFNLVVEERIVQASKYGIVDLFRIYASKNVISTCLLLHIVYKVYAFSILHNVINGGSNR